LYLINQSNEDSKRWQAQQAQQAQAQARAEEAAATAIRAEELSFRDVSVHKHWDNWELTAVVTNNSPYPLADVTFDITIEDCPDAGRCLTVGRAQTKATSGYDATSAAVPPGQTRAIASRYQIRFDGLPNAPQATTRKIAWKLIGVRAVPGAAAERKTTGTTTQTSQSSITRITDRQGRTCAVETDTKGRPPLETFSSDFHCPQP
jgi:hypothetical protein